MAMLPKQEGPPPPPQEIWDVETPYTRHESVKRFVTYNTEASVESRGLLPSRLKWLERVRAGSWLEFLSLGVEPG